MTSKLIRGRDCFLRYVETKVTKRLESNKLRASFKEAPKLLLLPLSLGVSSTALLHILDQQLNHQKARTGRFSFQIHVVFVDQSIALQQVDFEPSWRLLKERFPSHTYSKISLEDLFDYDSVLEFDNLSLRATATDDALPAKRNRLEQLLAGLPSATSRADMVAILRSQLISAFAQANNCESIVYGDCTTRLAERTLSETAKGRGGAIPWLTADGQSPHGIKIVYPMRDLLRKEITAYTKMTEPPLTSLIAKNSSSNVASASSKNATIEELMGQYFGSVEQHYPSIVANVVRTSMLASLAPLGGSFSLNPYKFEPFPLGSIKPLGWLNDQMSLMSIGLAGHEHDLFPIVSDSVWLGGHTEYSPLNEGIPYWLNGLVPLAYGLDDGRLKGQTWQVVDYILTHQQPDGWLGPEAPPDRDIWGRFPLCLALKQLVEADHDQSPKILSALYKFVDLMHTMLVGNIGYKQFWGKVRYPDMLIVLQWLYEKHPGKSADTLLATMTLLNQQGLSWAQYYTQGKYVFDDLDMVQPPIVDQSPLFPFVHAVNAVQGMKSGAVLYRFNNDASLLQSTRNGVNWTLTHHGDPAGSVVGDERESGLRPNRGSELCTAVETMYSLSYLYHAMGDREFADRCERAAFNALPVSITDDHWAHQYLVVPNQPFSSLINGPNSFYNTGDQSILYGMAPNYPCCTVNMPQGLPKFLSASFAHSGPNDLAHTLLSPARIITTLYSGTHVDLSCKTTYPFGNTLTYTFTASAPFRLHLRVPAWATSYNILSISNGISKTYTSKSLTPDPHTGLLYLDLLNTGTVTYKITADIRTEDRGNDTISIYRGALLYALDVGFADTVSPVAVSGVKDPNPKIPNAAHDHDIRATKPWNIAIDPSTLRFHSSPSVEESLKNPIWAYEAPPTWITAQGCEIEGWMVEKGVPAIPPLKGERK
ncbi:MAG: hypothetical protein Q9218_006205, partial [Villophora microphyllina]